MIALVIFSCLITCVSSHILEIVQFSYHEDLVSKGRFTSGSYDIDSQIFYTQYPDRHLKYDIYSYDSKIASFDHDVGSWTFDIVNFTDSSILWSIHDHKSGYDNNHTLYHSSSNDIFGYVVVSPAKTNLTVYDTSGSLIIHIYREYIDNTASLWHCKISLVNISETLLDVHSANLLMYILARRLSLRHKDIEYAELYGISKTIYFVEIISTIVVCLLLIIVAFNKRCQQFLSYYCCICSVRRKPTFMSNTAYNNYNIV